MDLEAVVLLGVVRVKGVAETVVLLSLSIFVVSPGHIGRGDRSGFYIREHESHRK